MVTAVAGMLDRTLRRLYAACAALAALAVVTLAVLVLISIVSRLLGVYVGGMTEGAGYALAATGALGLAQTLFDRGHIRVDLVLERLTGRIRHGVELAVLATSAGLVAYAAWFLCRMVRISWQFGDRSDGSDGLLLWMPQLPAAAGFVVFALALVHLTVLHAAGAAPYPSGSGVGEAEPPRA